MIEVLLAEALVRWGERRAIVAHDGTLSYRQLAEAMLLASARLRAHGVLAGDRVAVQLPNSCAAAVALLAAAQAGAVPVPVQSALKGDALRSLAANCEPRLVIAANSKVSGWSCPVLPVGPLLEPGNAPTAGQGAAAGDGAQLAAIIYTSGSTGQPKGVMLTRANMSAALDAVHDYLGPTEQDVYFSALPLSSSYGLYQLVSALSIGALLVLERSFAFPLQSLRSLAAHRATIFAAVPTQIAWIVAGGANHASLLTSLRIVTTAAAALPNEHASRLCALLPAVRLFVMYGQTECKRISYLDPADLPAKPGSVGKGLAIQQHLLLDDLGSPVAPGEAGELVVRGPHVMQGYWRAAELTAEKLRTVPGQAGLWLYTGDLFRADTDGYLYFLGRRDEIIKIGGHKVSPVEIENTLLQLASVREAAVIGVPDAEWGEVAMAYVVQNDGSTLDEEALRRHCAASLPRYMVPKRFVALPELPKTESGKVRKLDLR